MARFWCGSALALLVFSGESIAQPSLSDYGNFDFESVYFYPLTVGMRF